MQYLFAFGTPEEVRAEEEYLVDNYYRPDGRFMIALGNGYTNDWKTENLHEMYRATLAIRPEK